MWLLKPQDGRKVAAANSSLQINAVTCFCQPLPLEQHHIENTRVSPDRVRSAAAGSI
jgi:hypothetical protein